MFLLGLQHTEKHEPVLTLGCIAPPTSIILDVDESIYVTGRRRNPPQCPTWQARHGVPLISY